MALSRHHHSFAPVAYALDYASFRIRWNLNAIGFSVYSLILRLVSLILPSLYTNLSSNSRN